MYDDELDFTQDVLTLTCPECLVSGFIREILYKVPDGSEDLDRIIFGDPDLFGRGQTSYACTNCNWTD